MAQEAVWELVEFLALVPFSVMSSKVETSLTAFYDIAQSADMNAE